MLMLFHVILVGIIIPRFGEMYLNKKYPGRFKLIYGDSKKVIPTYAGKYKEKFDAVYIDGGHELKDALKGYH